MLRFLLNALLALLAVRFLLGIVRHAWMEGRIEDSRAPREGSRTSRDAAGHRRGEPGDPKRGSRPAVDRSTAIDVPYTEVETGEVVGKTAGEIDDPEGRE